MMKATELVIRVIRAFDALAIPYMVVGSFSSNVWGRPRSTQDADFVIEQGRTPIDRIASAIGGEFVLEPQLSFETITSTTRYRFRHRDTAFLIEIFLLSPDLHDQARFGRRVKGELNGQPIFVPTAEDVVITKLRWSRSGGRPKDADDVRDVLAVQSSRIDLDYVRHWCDQHGTRQLFEDLLKEQT